MKELMFGFGDETMISFQDRVFANPEGTIRSATLVVRAKDANTEEDYIVYLAFTDIPMENMDAFMELGYAMLTLQGEENGVIYIEGSETKDDN